MQRRVRKKAEFASGSKIVGENQEEMEKSLVTQDYTHSLGENQGEGSAEHPHCTCVDKPSRSHHEQF